MSKKQLVFIDDSGDPGFKGQASSAVFVMAGAVIVDSGMAYEISQAITQLKRSLGWSDDVEVKFRKSSQATRQKFLQTINKYDFDIYAVYVDKTKYPILFHFSDNEGLYNWAIKELLNVIPLENATVKIDGKYGNRYKMRLKAYIRRGFDRSARKIKTLSVQDSKKNDLIQLADLVAGAIKRSFSVEKTDSEEYIKIIKNKIIEIRELDLNNLDS